MQVGKYLNKRICFQTITGLKRTDRSFYYRVDTLYHRVKNHSLLESVGIEMVTQFPIDPMHCIDLGVTKKILGFIFYNKVPGRFVNVSKINSNLKAVAKFFPTEFGRTSRTIDDFHLWKATEFRSFLLYTGIFVLKNCVSEDVYYSFLLLHTAVRILSCEKACISNADVVEEMMVEFVKVFAIIYGECHVSFNVHCLLHLTDCVRKYGALDCFSAYKFENFMQFIKKLI